MSFTIQYCSDLHLEFDENRKYLNRNPIIPKGEILLLAGDILLLKEIEMHYDFFDYLSANFKQTYWIPGNHEYYGSTLSNWPSPLNIPIRHNVTLVNRQTLVHEDIVIITSTLWSHISPANELIIQKNLSDFRMIRNTEKQLSVTDFNEIHLSELTFIKNALSENTDKKKIILTHHIPTLKNYPKAFINSVYTEAFATELHDMVLASDAAYWIYGHHHKNIPAFKIGNTTLLTNQLGYVSHYEHKEYRRDATISI